MVSTPHGVPCVMWGHPQKRVLSGTRTDRDTHVAVCLMARRLTSRSGLAHENLTWSRHVGHTRLLALAGTGPFSLCLSLSSCLWDPSQMPSVPEKLKLVLKDCGVFPPPPSQDTPSGLGILLPSCPMLIGVCNRHASAPPSPHPVCSHASRGVLTGRAPPLLCRVGRQAWSQELTSV